MFGACRRLLLRCRRLLWLLVGLDCGVRMELSSPLLEEVSDPWYEF